MAAKAAALLKLCASLWDLPPPLENSANTDGNTCGFALEVMPLLYSNYYFSRDTKRSTVLDSDDTKFASSAPSCWVHVFERALLTTAETCPSSMNQEVLAGFLLSVKQRHWIQADHCSPRDFLPATQHHQTAEQ